MCGKQILENPTFYVCDGCGLKIYKLIADKKITPQIISELLTHGKSSFFDDFYSATKKKHFTAALTIENRAVKFMYPVRNSSPQLENELDHTKPSTIKLRVQSDNSGAVNVSLSGRLFFKSDISYGLVPARMAECLGCITAVKYIKHYLKNVSCLRLTISLNNLDFSRYLLRERKPRDAEIKTALDYLHLILNDFTWDASFSPVKRPHLTGSPQSSTFPLGVFPWLKVEVNPSHGDLTIKLPDSPDVIAQFKASLWKATPGDEKGLFALSQGSQKAITAWISNVTKEQRS